MIYSNHITPELRELRKHFVAGGFDIRLVGGVVRDLLTNNPVKDVDLCTDATPAEQIEIYQQQGIRWIETGLQHGTVTVVLNQVPYEITSLRIDAETDGRHATVKYTRDWVEDLARRDLTINAMSMTFDGDLIDPFDGFTDLQNNVVRFVGDPNERIREDYLRILRWFRFQGRFGTWCSINDATLVAINENAPGLKNISRERVWSEIRRIVQHSSASVIMQEMWLTRVGRFIDLNRWNTNTFNQAKVWTNEPELLMAAGLNWDLSTVSMMANKWKWSNAERAHAEWMSKHLFEDCDLRRLIAVDHAPREWVAELAALEQRNGWEQNALVNWVFPDFPVNGNDLIQQGLRPGRVIGETLSRLRNAWAESGYVATKEDLIKMI